MPFLIIDDVDTSGNGFDELPPNTTIDDVTQIILAELNKQLTTVVSEAVDAALYIKNPSGVKVCRFTGRIVD